VIIFLLLDLLGQFVLSTPKYETYQHTQKKHIDELGSFSLLSEKTILEFAIQQMILGNSCNFNCKFFFNLCF
jgi:hypothetical protein